MEFEALKLAVICARVSSDDPKHERLDDQLKECRKWAEEHEYRVVTEVVENGVSGGLAVEERPQLWKAIEQLRAGHIQALITRELDQLGRRLDTAALVEELSAYGDGVQFVRQPRLDDPEAEIIQNGLGGVIARLERQRIYRCTSQGRNRRAREGKGGGIGRLPRWLTWADEQIMLVDEEAHKVKTFLSKYAGRGSDVLAREAGFRPADINHLVLRNPAVAGRRYVFPLSPRPMSASDTQRRRRKVVWGEIAGAATVAEADVIAESHEMIIQHVPPLITWERFAEIQRLLTRSGTRGRPPKERLPLQGRVYCSVHELQYTPVGKPHIYGECTARKGQQARDHGKCVGPRVPWLEHRRGKRSLLSLVTEALGSPQAARRSVRDALTYIADQIDRLESETEDTDGKVDRLKQKKARLALLWADGDMPDESWKTQKTRIDRQISEANRRAADHKGELRRLTGLREQQIFLNESLEFGLNPYALFQMASLENNLIDDLAQQFDLRIYVETDRLRIEGTIPVKAVDLSPSETDSKCSRVEIEANGVKNSKLSGRRTSR